MVLPIQLVNSKEFEHDFIIVDTPLSFEADILLGLDFLHKYSIKLDWGQGWMYACEEEIPLFIEDKQNESQLDNVGNQKRNRE